MKISSTPRIAGIGPWLLAAGALLYPVVYLIIALIRLFFPFELEWMEGGVVAHVQRILDGQPLYGPPSLDFVPYIYTPLYYYAGSLTALVFGNGFFPLRLVSLLSSLGCFVFIFLIVRRRTSSSYAALVSMCLFAATYRISGAWFDIARVDSLFLLFLMAALYAFDAPRRSIRLWATPLLLFLSFLTKQPALMVALGLSFAAFASRKGVERFSIPVFFFALFLISFLVMNAATNGWYAYYVFYLPAGHDIVKSLVMGFWINDVARHLLIACCVVLVPFVKQRIPDVFILGSLILAAYSSRIHSGGYDNVLMPAYAGISIYFGIGFSALLEKAGDGNSRWKLALLSVVALQFFILYYPPLCQIPSALDKRQGEKLLQRIAAIPGKVYMSAHPWYLGIQKRPMQAHEMAVWDIQRASNPDRGGGILEREMARAIETGEYDAFIVDYKDFVLRVPDFDRYYFLAESALCGSALHPLTGWDRKPTYVYLKRTDADSSRSRNVWTGERRLK